MAFCWRLFVLHRVRWTPTFHTQINRSWCYISPHNEVKSHFIKALSSTAPPCSYLQDFIICPMFWIAGTMDTAAGEEGVGLADMNSSSKTQLGCGRHGSRVHLTHLISSRLWLSKQCVTFWWIHQLKGDVAPQQCLSPQVTSSMTSWTCWSTRSWVSPGNFCFITWW